MNLKFYRSTPVQSTDDIRPMAHTTSVPGTARGGRDDRARHRGADFFQGRRGLPPPAPTTPISPAHRVAIPVRVLVLPRPDQHQRPIDRRGGRGQGRAPQHLRRRTRPAASGRRTTTARPGRRCSNTCRPRASAMWPSRRRTRTSSGSAPARRTSFARRWPGVGIYKSTDAGKTWQHMGLTDTQTISRIIVHPTNPEIVYVAATGHEWTDNEMRGVFKTTNGGRTWTKIYYKSPRTGAIDLVMDPNDPNTLYAAMWQRIRRKWSDPRVEPGYSEGGIVKTTDGGATWTDASAGLPAPQFRGRIGIDISRSNPQVLYAFVDNYDIGRVPPPGSSATRTAGRCRKARASSRARTFIDRTTRARRGSRPAGSIRRRPITWTVTRAPTVGSSAKSASIRRTRTRSTRWGWA